MSAHPDTLGIQFQPEGNPPGMWHTGRSEPPHDGQRFSTRCGLVIGKVAGFLIVVYEENCTGALDDVRSVPFADVPEDNRCVACFAMRAQDMAVLIAGSGS